MSEPAFYKCGKCSRTWSRVEYKMAQNPPRVCPHCGDTASQGVDERREQEYVRAVYRPMVDSLFGSKK